MAIYCGVCTERIFAAYENGGSFQVTSEFKGALPRISDTCESCAKILSEAVTKAANKIVANNQEAVDAMKRDIAMENYRRARLENERADFEREWSKRKSNIT